MGALSYDLMNLITFQIFQLWYPIWIRVPEYKFEGIETKYYKDELMIIIFYLTDNSIKILIMQIFYCATLE